MTSTKGKLRMILLVFVVLAMMSVACDVEPGDGQVREAVIDANSAIRDAATEVKDAVESTGEGLEVEKQGTVILDAVWDIAKDIAEGE